MPEVYGTIVHQGDGTLRVGKGPTPDMLDARWTWETYVPIPGYIPPTYRLVPPNPPPYLPAGTRIPLVSWGSQDLPQGEVILSRDFRGYGSEAEFVKPLPEGVSLRHAIYSLREAWKRAGGKT